MIICVTGPTAVGKTALSIALAHRYNAIIINCDAMQVYKGLDIGTAKVTEEEKESVPHYLLDFVPVDANYTVFDYQKDARKVLNELLKENKNVKYIIKNKDVWKDKICNNEERNEVSNIK